MPHDPIRAADTRAWLAKADMDLNAAAHGAPPEPAVEEAEQAIALAREVYEAVGVRLPAEGD